MYMVYIFNVSTFHYIKRMYYIILALHHIHSTDSVNTVIITKIDHKNHSKACREVVCKCKALSEETCWWWVVIIAHIPPLSLLQPSLRS